MCRPRIYEENVIEREIPQNENESSDEEEYDPLAAYVNGTYEAIMVHAEQRDPAFNKCPPKFMPLNFYLSLHRNEEYLPLLSTLKAYNESILTNAQYSIQLRKNFQKQIHIWLHYVLMGIDIREMAVPTFQGNFSPFPELWEQALDIIEEQNTTIHNEMIENFIPLNMSPMRNYDRLILWNYFPNY